MGQDGTGPEKGRAARATRAGRIVRRRPEDRRLVPTEILDLAEGRIDRLPVPTERRFHVRDPREAYLIPGVANRDARAVFDARLAELKTLVEKRKGGDAAVEALLSDRLAEAALLGLWRGGSVTSLDSLAEDILGIRGTDAANLATAGARRADLPPERLDDGTVATWLRAEAGLLEARVCGQVRAVRRATGLALVVELPIGRAPMGLAAIGRRAAQLAPPPTRDPRRDRPPRR